MNTRNVGRQAYINFFFFAFFCGLKFDSLDLLILRIGRKPGTTL